MFDFRCNFTHKNKILGKITQAFYYLFFQGQNLKQISKSISSNIKERFDALLLLSVILTWCSKH